MAGFFCNCLPKSHLASAGHLSTLGLEYFHPLLQGFHWQMKQCTGTFLVSGIDLSRLINSGDGPRRWTCPHQPTFSQAVPERGLGVGGF